MWSVVVALPTLQAEFGVDRGEASLPYTATMVGFAAGGILMGRLLDRFGLRPLLIFAAAMLAGGYLLAAQATTLWQFMAAQTLLIGMLGSAVGFAPLVADATLWFRRRRGIAVSIVASGNYLAGTVWPPILQYAIDTVGWRQAHVMVGLFCLAAMVPLALLLRRRPRTDADADATGPGHAGPAPAPLPQGRLQIMLVVAGLSCCIAMSMPQVHIVAYCGDLGYGVARGAEMLSLMLGFGIVSRLASGLIADRIGGAGTLLLGSTLQCLALFFYLPFDGLTPLYIVSALFGLSQGGIVPSYALIVRDHFPAREAGRRISLVLMMTVVGMAIGGWMSGEIYAHTGSYRAAFLNGIAFNLLNMSIAFWLLLGRLRARRARVAA
ncbi:MAG: MFS transporter [Hyphomicrobiales bacterium]|nr:MFS transporter [Hyphomicrobiales bacterium]MCP5371692.1 MFS transporter [Hyphomicrobiales bacterium]